MSESFGPDIFISHASEDKDAFVRPLAFSLNRLGVQVWYDEFSMRIGDSLSESIDRGLAGARYGAVVISKAFLSKPWPKRELRGLVAKELASGGRNVVLPIWHGVTKSHVLRFSPMLADTFALDTRDLDAEQIAVRLTEAVRPDIYEGHPLVELKRMASGEALQCLRQEITETRAALEGIRDELSEFKCHYCGSSLELFAPVPVDRPYEDSVLLRRFACGYEEEDGYRMSRPCPSQPGYPTPEDYELIAREESTGNWYCVASPKTHMARLVEVPSGMGSTREEAVAMVRRQLPKQRLRLGGPPHRGGFDDDTK